MPDLNEEGASILSNTTVDHSAIAATPLYTVPPNKKFIPDHIKVIAAGNEAATIVSVGLSTALTDFLPNQTLSNLDAADDFVIIKPIQAATPLKLQVYTAGEIFSVDVTTNVGNAGNIYVLFGHLRNA